MLSILSAILLGILKFILFLLGLILIIICLILFVPIKYNIIGISEDLFAKHKFLDVDISWFFKLLKINIKDDKSVKVFIFGIELFKKKPKKLNTKQKSEQPKQEKKQEKKQNKKSTTSQKNNINKNKNKNKNKKNKKQKKSETKKTSKFKDLKSKFDKYYNHPDRDLIITKTKELAIKLLKALKPKQSKIDIELGLDNPYLLGQIVGYSAALCGILNKDLFLHGNFQEKILKVDICIRGKLIMWKLTYPLVRYAFVKPITKIIKNKIKGR